MRGSVGIVGLLEREGALARIRRGIESVTAGAGVAIVIEGPAGIGKTELLRATTEIGEAAGLRTLSARGGELERELPFGAVRELLGAEIAELSPAERGEVLSGSARYSLAVLDPGREAGGSGGEPTSAGDGNGSPEVEAAAIVHGLHWLCANLVERQPLLLTVDDAHWVDPGSLRFLAYLVRRIADLPLAVALSRRVAEPAGGEPRLEAIAGAPAAIRIEPEPLSEEAVGELARARFKDADEDFCRACHRAATGNPFLTNELLSALEAEGETARAATASLPRLAGGAVSRAILTRFLHLPETASSLARAAAVLGGRAELRHCAALAGLEHGPASEAADALRAAGVLAPERSIDFAHPLVKEAVYGQIRPSRRAALHAKAARLLADEGADEALVAGHLLESEPLGDEWVVARLRNAAQAALDRGAPEGAATYLARALTEPPPRGERATLLRELGRAEARAGIPAGVGHLREAIELTAGADRARAVRELAGFLFSLGRGSESIELLDGALAQLAEAERELRHELETDLAALAALHLHRGPASLDARLEALAARARDGSDPRLHVCLAFVQARENSNAADVVHLAEVACGEGDLLREVGPESLVLALATQALVVADGFAPARRLVARALETARASGSMTGIAMANDFLGWIAYRRGQVQDATVHARVCLEVAREHGFAVGIASGLAGLLEALLERGELEEATRELDDCGLADELPELAATSTLIERRGRLRAARGQLEAGLADLIEAGRLRASRGVISPGFSAGARTPRSCTGGSVRVPRPSDWRPRSSSWPAPSGRPGRSEYRSAPRGSWRAPRTSCARPSPCSPDPRLGSSTPGPWSSSAPTSAATGAGGRRASRFGRASSWPAIVLRWRSRSRRWRSCEPRGRDRAGASSRAPRRSPPPRSGPRSSRPPAAPTARSPRSCSSPPARSSSTSPARTTSSRSQGERDSGRRWRDPQNLVRDRNDTGLRRSYRQHSDADLDMQVRSGEGGRRPAVVIGAGPAGLASAAELRRRGVEAIVLERSEAIAAAWRDRYDRLRLNTSRLTATLPGMRYPRGTPLFPSRDQVVRYLDAYAERNRLEVRLATRVERIDREPGGWLVRSSDGEHAAAHVIVATGYENTPLIPQWPGRNRFRGRLLHAAEYRTAEPFRGSDMLVVGAGSSGVEIAFELATDGAARVRLAVRTPPTFLLRSLGGVPGDIAGIAMLKLPTRLADAQMRVIRRLVIGDLSERGLPAPEIEMFTRYKREGKSPAVVDREMIEAIRANLIEIVPAVEALEDDGVRLTDGELIDVDAVIAATGYRRGLEPLVGHLGVLDERGRPRIAGGREAAPGLRFVGYVLRPGQFGLIGREARRAAKGIATSSRDGLAGAVAAAS